MKYYLVFLSLIFLLLFLYRMIQGKLKSKKDKIISIIAILAQFAIVLLQHLLTEETNPDYVNLNCPYLEPELVITESDSSGFRFHYVISNVGALPAENLQFSFKSPHVSGAEFLPPFDRQLAPGGKMKYMPQPLKTSYKKGNTYQSFILIISYTSKIKGIKKEYYSVFRNSMSNTQIQLGNHIYDDASRYEGMFTNDAKLNFIGFEKQMIEFKKYPGISFHLLISIERHRIEREQYIFDSGLSLLDNRISLYLDSNNNLQFRIFDSNLVEHRLELPSDFPDFKFGQLMHVNVEIGRGEKSSFLSIFINGNPIRKLELPSILIVHDIDNILNNFVIGADLQGKNGGFFDLAEFATYGSTLDDDERVGLAKYFENREPKQVVSFKGNHWMKMDTNSKNFIQDSSLTRPVVRKQ